MSDPKPRVLVIGIGLIGGSLAAGARSSGHYHVLACDRDEQSLQIALAEGIIDAYYLDLAEAVAAADLIVLAVPILSLAPVLKSLASLDLGCKVITDTGSAKQCMVDAALAAFGEVPVRLVPGHPIAGSEKSGVTAANPELYQQHKVILTPLEHTDADAVEQVRALWQSVGAEVLEMGVEQHDQVLAFTSHLPHLLAFSLVDTLAQKGNSQEIFRYAAGGFRDFTRIAASDPTMWHDIFVANRSATLAALDEFTADLMRLRQAVDQSETQHLLGVFTRAKAAREHFSRMLAQKAYSEPMEQKDLTIIARSARTLRGAVRVPGDKSISHRSIMLGSLAEGVTQVEGFLEGEDALATLQAFRDMGVVIEGPHDGRVTIYGVGLHGLKPAPGPLYVGNSGTSMRLLAGLLAGQPFDVTLTGDHSLSQRPMERVARPLREMGAEIETAEQGRPPMLIKGGAPLRGIHYQMPMASAQVKSCVLLAGLYADGETSVTEPAPTRDHTERMLKGFGYPVEVDGDTVRLRAGGKLTGTHIEVPADISSAAFFMVAASIAEDADVLLKHVGINPTRVGVINILKAMGADLTLENEREVGGEPVADIRVRSAKLHGIEIPEDQVPLAIDEFPVLFVAAACAEGKTVLRGAEELRVKESDRIQVMADGLAALGVDVKPTPDGIEIVGGPMGSATVDSHSDHRIAMSFAVAALRAQGVIEIRDCANVATSFPNFIALAKTLGFDLDLQESEA